MTAPATRPFLSASMITVILAELAHRALAVPFAHELASVGMLATVFLAWRQLGFREFYLIGLSATVLVLQFFLADEPWAVVDAAFGQASFLMAFILLLGMLYEAASTSPSIAACGNYLTRQPAGRRYYALNSGAAFLSVLFNIGVLSFLTVLIRRGIELSAPDDPLNPVRERRQLSAMLRGFAWCVIWSPTAVAPLAVGQLIPGTDRHLWTVYGLGIFVLVLFVGAFEDRLRFRHYRSAAKVVIPPVPTRAIFYFIAACSWLFGMAAFFVWLTGDTMIFGLLMACPLMLFGWLAVQLHGAQQPMFEHIADRFRTMVMTDFPKSAPVAVTLAASGLIGRAAAELVPAAELAAFLQLDAIPDFILLGSIPIVLALLSLLALSPIMMAVFFGSLFGSLPELPADPTLIALSISCGWALSMTFSPYATVVLLISRTTDIPGRRLTWDWNLTFTLIAAMLLFGVFAILA